MANRNKTKNHFQSTEIIKLVDIQSSLFEMESKIDNIEYKLENKILIPNFSQIDVERIIVTVAVVACTVKYLFF